MNDIDISALFQRIGKTIIKIKMDEIEKISGDKININLYQYIFAIGINQHPSYSDLAKYLHVSKPAVTAAVNNLIKLGLVKKVQSTEDKRLFYLSLSKMGEEIFLIHYIVKEKVEDMIKNKLTENEYKKLLQLLTKVIE